ncbi:hypothetical protein HSB1_39090 [Halogranum salarium B-1]|uniref:Uncharacterized protein n=1 Tax=Halogranum salarium B-1 TaxID=1210908 RepID=J2ZWZ5_9EURY|nr:hypothetical protein HSB1_39090 [Halogranum salarium B-1]
MYPLKNRLKRAFYAEETQNRFCLSERQTAAWSRTANALTGVPRNLRFLVCEREAKRLVNVTGTQSVPVGTRELCSRVRRRPLPLPTFKRRSV